MHLNYGSNNTVVHFAYNSYQQNSRVCMFEINHLVNIRYFTIECYASKDV